MVRQRRAAIMTPSVGSVAVEKCRLQPCEWYSFRLPHLATTWPLSADHELALFPHYQTLVAKKASHRMRQTQQLTDARAGPRNAAAWPEVRQSLRPSRWQPSAATACRATDCCAQETTSPGRIARAWPSKVNCGGRYPASNACAGKDWLQSPIAFRPRDRRAPARTATLQ